MRKYKWFLLTFCLQITGCIELPEESAFICNIDMPYTNPTEKMNFFVKFNFQGYKYLLGSEGGCEFRILVEKNQWGVKKYAKASYDNDTYACIVGKSGGINFLIDRYTGYLIAKFGSTSYYGSCKKLPKKL
ncbi:hypothetical protein Lnau_2135 [Legionella nautarum]|uniref:Uncharacterized protein n=1 Tax=Legionella nautarum TaxID=45070 RepID=A0A0W0WNG2_9GAMM|nr:hypothetical protein [Legionella nautarum]KTD33843.1 hypothetical protein Lnau_2135 [Legionella nautarum]